MKPDLLRPLIAVLIASWMMVACGGGGGGGGQISADMTGRLGGDGVVPSQEVSSCSTAGRVNMKGEDERSKFTFDFDANTMTDLVPAETDRSVTADDGSEVDPSRDEAEPVAPVAPVYDFRPKLNEDRTPVACTFTVRMNGTTRDLFLINERLFRWLD